MIDTHAHLGDELLFAMKTAVLQHADSAGVEWIVDICTNDMTLERGYALQQCHDHIALAAATTPHDVDTDGEHFFPIVEKAAYDGKLIAIGETGLDYFYEHSSRDTQQQFLLRYIELATKTTLPLIFHCRGAFADLFTIAKDMPKVLIHCFTGTKEEAMQALNLGWYLSISGIVTFKKSQELRDVISCIPIDRLVIETDAPYLAPQSKRGMTNEPAFMIETATCLATLKGITVEECIYHTTANAKRFFSLQS